MSRQRPEDSHHWTLKEHEDYAREQEREYVSTLTDRELLERIAEELAAQRVTLNSLYELA